MAVIEGHAEHVIDAVAPSCCRRCRSCARRSIAAATPQSGRARLLAKLLGLEMKMRQYEHGKTVLRRDRPARRQPTRCRRVLRAEALPTIDELSDPVAWLLRMGLPVLGGGAPELPASS